VTAVAAVDLGGQSGRVAVVEFDGERIALEVVHRFENRPVGVHGTLYWDVLGLYAEVTDGLRLAGRERQISSVAVDSWGVDFGLIDGFGRLVGNPVHYRDARRAKAYSDVVKRIPPREIYRRTGIQLMPINTLYELAAMVDEHDPALDRAARLLLIPDLLNYWLCGALSSELTNATTTQCFSVDHTGWDSELLGKLGIPTRLMPQVVSAGTELGPLLGDSARTTGLENTAVIAGATHDTAAAVAGTPLRGDYSAFLSCGTWSLVGVESLAPVTSDEAFAANLTNEGGVNGTVRILRNVTGLWLLHECRRAWAQAGRSYDWTELLQLASTTPEFGSFVDPNDPSFQAPGAMPERIAEYCRHTAQKVPTDEAAVVRCVLESLALKHAEVLDLLSSVVGRPIDAVHLVGGGATNELLCSWTAHASNVEVIAGPEEATLVGNAVTQLIAAGEISSLEEGRELIKKSFGVAWYRPTQHSHWAEARERFSALSSISDEAEVTV